MGLLYQLETEMERGMPAHEQRHGPAGRRRALPSVLRKTAATALKPASLGLSYAAASEWVRSMKSSLCQGWARYERPTTCWRCSKNAGLINQTT